MPSWNEDVKALLDKIRPGVTAVGGLAVMGLCILVAWLLLPWKQWVNTLGGSGYPSQIWRWAVATLIAFVLLNTLYFMVRSFSRRNTPDPSMLFSVFWAIFTFILIVLSIPFLYGDPIHQVFAMLSVAGGALTGWLVGMYISPQGSSERQEFAKIGTAVAGLASGYTLKSAQTWLGSHAEYQIYAALGVICAAITTATIYNIRAYGSSVNISFASTSADPKDKQKATVLHNVPLHLKAAVTGVVNADGLADSSVKWEVLPDSTAAGADVSHEGVFTATGAGSCQVIARSVGNPKLSDVVEITVT